MTASGFEIRVIKGDEGPKGIRIRDPEDMERVYRYIRVRRKRGKLVVQKFKISVPGEEGTVVVEYRNRRKFPSTSMMFGEEKEFLAYRFDQLRETRDPDR